MNSEHYLEENELVAGLNRVRQAPTDQGTVLMIVARPESNARKVLPEGELTPDAGLVGDRWARSCSRRLPDGQVNPDTQLTLINSRLIELLARGEPIWELAGDNLVVDLDLSQTNLPVGQRLRIGSALVEITFQPHTGCAKFSKRFGPEALKFVNSPEGKQLRLRGVHAQVIHAGVVRTGDPIAKA